MRLQEKEGGKSHQGCRREKKDHRLLPKSYKSIVDIYSFRSGKLECKELINEMGRIA